MAFNQPVVVVDPSKFEQCLAEFLDGVEGRDPEQVKAKWSSLRRQRCLAIRRGSDWWFVADVSWFH